MIINQQLQLKNTGRININIKDFQKMTAHVKILQLNSNLSKLIDSLCFQLAVNSPDSNSLSLLEIIEWKNSDQISQEQFRELYSGWLESKNIQDIFSTKQIKTYPKQDLIQYQGPIKKLISVNEITKTLQILNAHYNELYIQKKQKSQTILSKAQIIKSIEEAEKLFSILDSNGVINLRLNEIFFLTASILITENKPIPSNFQQMKQCIKKIMQEMCEIDGNISLRAFKNYFLSKYNTQQLKGIILVLDEIQNFMNSQKNIHNPQRQGATAFPQMLQESISKWKTDPKFKSKQKKIQFLKRIFEENEKSVYFNSHTAHTFHRQIQQKYGQELLDCVQIDEKMLSQFLQIHQEIVGKYLILLQRNSSLINKNIKNIPRYIEQSSSNSYINLSTNFETSMKKKISSNSQFGTATKKISKTPTKDRTPHKARKNLHDYTAPNNYKNRTPTQKAYTYIHNQFGSAQKINNTSGYIASGRQTTPTKSTLSFATDAPRTYRAAQKKGLQQNNFYDKLFFFRNKRVESYEIVMKRLKNK